MTGGPLNAGINAVSTWVDLPPEAAPFLAASLDLATEVHTTLAALPEDAAIEWAVKRIEDKIATYGNILLSVDASGRFLKKVRATGELQADRDPPTVQLRLHAKTHYILLTAAIRVIDKLRAAGVDSPFDALFNRGEADNGVPIGDEAFMTMGCVRAKWEDVIEGLKSVAGMTDLAVGTYISFVPPKLRDDGGLHFSSFVVGEAYDALDGALKVRGRFRTWFKPKRFAAEKRRSLGSPSPLDAALLRCMPGSLTKDQANIAVALSAALHGDYQGRKGEPHLTTTYLSLLALFQPTSGDLEIDVALLFRLLDESGLTYKHEYEYWLALLRSVAPPGTALSGEQVANETIDHISRLSSCTTAYHFSGGRIPTILRRSILRSLRLDPSLHHDIATFDALFSRFAYPIVEGFVPHERDRRDFRSLSLPAPLHELIGGQPGNRGLGIAAKVSLWGPIERELVLGGERRWRVDFVSDETEDVEDPPATAGSKGESGWSLHTLEEQARLQLRLHDEENELLQQVFKEQDDILAKAEARPQRGQSRMELRGVLSALTKFVKIGEAKLEEQQAALDELAAILASLPFTLPKRAFQAVKGTPVHGGKLWRPDWISVQHAVDRSSGPWSSSYQLQRSGRTFLRTSASPHHSAGEGFLFATSDWGADLYDALQLLRKLDTIKRIFLPHGVDLRAFTFILSSQPIQRRRNEVGQLRAVFQACLVELGFRILEISEEDGEELLDLVQYRQIPWATALMQVELFLSLPASEERRKMVHLLQALANWETYVEKLGAHEAALAASSSDSPSLDMDRALLVPPGRQKALFKPGGRLSDLRRACASWRFLGHGLVGEVDVEENEDDEGTGGEEEGAGGGMEEHEVAGVADKHS
ncbi:hypothetical protein JCM11641_002588 [Rhodosporidiobolus odoratus]